MKFNFSGLLCLLFVLLLSACTEKGSKSYLIDFSSRIKVESRDFKIELPSDPDLSLVNFKRNYKSKKLSSYDLIALPTIINGNMYYVDESNTVSCFDMDSKKKIWTNKLLQNAEFKNYGGGIIKVDGILYITIGNNYLYILNSEDGTEVRRIKFNGILRSSPIHCGGNIILQTISNEVIGINKNDYNIIWNDKSWSTQIENNNDVLPKCYINTVLSAFTNGQLNFYNSYSGEKIHYAELDKNLTHNSSWSNQGVSYGPIIDESNCYAHVNNNNLIKMNMKDFKTIYSKEIKDIQNFSIIGNAIFATTNAMQIIAISKNDGKVIWATDIYVNKDKTRFIDVNSFITTPIYTKEGIIIFDSKSKGHLFNHINGNKIRTYKIPPYVNHVTTYNGSFIAIRKNYLLTEY